MPVPFRALFLRAAAIVSVASVVACSPTVTVHGYVPTEEDVESIEVGVDTQASLEERIGRPSSSGLLAGSDWYYVQTTFEQLTYNPPKATDRVVVAVAFDDQGVVTGVDRYGLEDGRIIALNPRVTEAGGQRRNILRQIFGGLLNIDAGQILGGN